MKEGSERKRERQETFHRGDLVRLRDDVDPNVAQLIAPRIQAGVAYRVLDVQTYPEGDSTVWLGSADMHPRDVADFKPELAFENLEERYRGVLPIGAVHLQPLLH